MRSSPNLQRQSLSIKDFSAWVATCQGISQLMELSVMAAMGHGRLSARVSAESADLPIGKPHRTQQIGRAEPIARPANRLATSRLTQLLGIWVEGGGLRSVNALLLGLLLEAFARTWFF